MSAGSYAGFILRTSGTEDGWIVIKPASQNEIVCISEPGGQNTYTQHESLDGELVFAGYSYVELEGISYVRIEGLTIVGSGAYGVTLADPRGPSGEIGVSHIDIVDCEIIDSGGSSIFLPNVESAQIAGNTILGSGYQGIHIRDGGAGISVEGNTISGCYHAAVMANNEAGTAKQFTDFIVKDNLITNCFWGLAMVGVQGGEVSENTILNNTGGGIRLFSMTACHDITFSSNHIDVTFHDLDLVSEDADWAVYVQSDDCSGLVFTDNYLSWSGMTNEDGTASGGSFLVAEGLLDGESLISNGNTVSDSFATFTLPEPPVGEGQAGSAVGPPSGSSGPSYLKFEYEWMSFADWREASGQDMQSTQY